MGIGPISATQKTLAKAGLTVGDVDLFEINEAFAAQCIACQRTLGIDLDTSLSFVLADAPAPPAVPVLQRKTYANLFTRKGAVPPPACC